MKRVIIVGCGFGGLNVARGLSADLEVLIFDRRNHHLFQPLLYQVAMAGLSPAEISHPIRSVFRHNKNVRVLLAEVTEIRRLENKIITRVGEFSYDYLVLACGAEDSYFGHEDWKEFAPGLKSVEQATEIRRRVLSAFEQAEVEEDATRREAQMTFAIIGGGPTGVELAGALGEITRFTLAKDFRRINPRQTKIYLVEGGPRILASFAESLSRAAVLELEGMGVQIMTGGKVTAVNADGLQIGDRFLPARTVIWAAGVKPSPLNAGLNTPLDKGGRVLVNRDLSVPGSANVFVLGDQAAFLEDGKALPGLAPVAIQQGKFLAKVIRGRLPAGSEFKYFDKGQMATIGRRSAVVQLGRLRFSGYIAWLMWLVIHVYFLIGFRNRFFVIWEWTFSYFNYRRGARIITRRDWESAEGSLRGK